MQWLCAISVKGKWTPVTGASKMASSVSKTCPNSTEATLTFRVESSLLLLTVATPGTGFDNVWS